MTAAEFVAKWSKAELTEKSAAQRYEESGYTMKSFLHSTVIVKCLGVALGLAAAEIVSAEEKPASPPAEKPVGLLVKLGIEKDERKIVTQIYDELVNPDDLKKGVGYFVAETDRKGRARAVELGKSPNSIATLAGTWMEYSLMVALKQRNKTPLYWQAEFKDFRNNFYDIAIFTKEYGPVVLSPKTSLRERYKQADLEGGALRGMFPKSQFYLLSLDQDKKHIANIQRKVKDGEIKGLTALYDEANMDELFKLLDSLTVVEAAPGLLHSGRLIK